MVTGITPIYVYMEREREENSFYLFLLGVHSFSYLPDSFIVSASLIFSLFFWLPKVDLVCFDFLLVCNLMPVCSEHALFHMFIPFFLAAVFPIQC
jgi:hypothetical protein